MDGERDEVRGMVVREGQGVLVVTINGCLCKCERTSSERENGT